MTPRTFRGSLEARETPAGFLLAPTPPVHTGRAAAEREKRTVLIDFVTTLARVLTRRGNRVGAMVYGSDAARTIPAGSGRVQVLRLVEELLRQPRLEGSPLPAPGPVLATAHRRIPRRS